MKVKDLYICNDIDDIGRNLWCCEIEGLEKIFISVDGEIIKGNKEIGKEIYESEIKGN